MPIGTQTADEIIDKILHLPEGTKVYIMAPLERRDGEQYEALWDELRASGFARVRVDGQSISLDNPPKLSHRRKHKVEVVVDRAVVRRSTRSRLADSIESALDLGKGVVHVARVGDESREPSWAVDASASIASAIGAGAALTSWRLIIFRSTARWAGARSARGWACSKARTRRVLVPDGRLACAEGPSPSGRISRQFRSLRR